MNVELIVTLCTVVGTGAVLAGLMVSRWNSLDARLRAVETGLAELRGALFHGDALSKIQRPD